MARYVLLLGVLMILTASCGPATQETVRPEPTEPPIDPAATVAAAISRSDAVAPTREPPDVRSAKGTITPIPATTSEMPTVTATRVTEAAAPDPVPATPTPSDAETVIPSAKANEVAGNWLLSFTHTNPDYVRYAHSAFAFAEDGEFCQAASRFGAIAIDARDYAGERLPIAAYNAGVLYLILAWDDRRIAGHAMCTTSNPARPAINSAVAALEYALEYMTDSQHKSAAHVLLGRAYANLAHMAGSRLVIGETSAREQAETVSERSETAVSHLCQSIALSEAHNDLAHKILTEIDSTCGQ